jgi:penicillin-binding protein 1C
VRSPGGTSRADWFLRGTEPEEKPVAAESPRPRLASPVAGTIIALDPDIPPGQQSVPFEADAGAGLRFSLNGRDLGDASLPFDWNPTPGRYTLALVDGGGRTLDSTAFEVRGALVAEADEAAPPPDEPSDDDE